MSYREERPATQNELITWHTLIGHDGRPPTDDRTVLVTIRNESMITFVTIARCRFGVWVDVQEFVLDFDVLAWADLPAPFKD